MKTPDTSSRLYLRADRVQQVPDLVVHVARIFDGRCDFFGQEVAKAAPQAVDCHLLGRRGRVEADVSRYVVVKTAIDLRNARE